MVMWKLLLPKGNKNELLLHANIQSCTKYTRRNVTICRLNCNFVPRISSIAIQLDQILRNTLWMFVNLQHAFWGLKHFLSKARGFKSIASNLFLHVPLAITRWNILWRETAAKLTHFAFSGNSGQRDKINEISWLIFQNHFQKLFGNVRFWS